MIFYAIQQKSTGWYLPQRKSSKGFTTDEPREHCIPRLFKRKSDATLALKWWLKGKWRYKLVYTTFSYYTEEELVSTLVPSRKKEDMEIVEIGLFKRYTIKEIQEMLSRPLTYRTSW